MHGQHSQLEAWVNDSCQALEKLHGELTQWQNELARKQTELDLREDALEKCQSTEEEVDARVSQWKAELDVACREAQQLREENGDQLEHLNQLERRCFSLEAELKSVRQESAELASTLATEREHASREQDQWKQEFKDMRALLDKQVALSSSPPPGDEQSDASPNPLGEEAPASGDSSEGLTRSEALRQRAQERLAARRSEA
jgi:chromosome segregation ATPase